MAECLVRTKAAHWVHKRAALTALNSAERTEQKWAVQKASKRAAPKVASKAVKMDVRWAVLKEQHWAEHSVSLTVERLDADWAVHWAASTEPLLAVHWVGGKAGRKACC